MKRLSLPLLLFLLCLLLLASPGPNHAGIASALELDNPLVDAYNVELIDQVGGASYSVAVQGHYAYLGIGPRLVIMDIADPDAPRIVGQTPPMSDIVRDIAISYQYAYVAAGDIGLRVVDISNPLIPIEVGFYDAMEKVEHVVVVEDIAYVAADQSGLVIIDITNSSNPTEIGRYETASPAQSVTVMDTLAYVAFGQNGLAIVDVTDPSRPTGIGQYESNAYYDTVSVVSNYAYLGGYDGVFEVLDISNPTNPVQVGKVEEYYRIEAIVVSGRYAFLATFNMGRELGEFVVIDISDPVNPEELSRYPTSGSKDIALSGMYALVAERGNGMRILEISNLESIQEISWAIIGIDAKDVALDSLNVYVVGEPAGLRIVDISNPTRIIGAFEQANRAVCVTIANTKAYIGEWFWGFIAIVDVSNLLKPVSTGSYLPPFPTSTDDVTVSEDNVYLAYGTEGIWILDVSDPSEPVELGSIDTPGAARGVAVVGNYAYVADGSSGLRVLSVSDPSNPVELGSINTPGDARGVAVVGNYAYVADGSSTQS